MDLPDDGEDACPVVLSGDIDPHDEDEEDDEDFNFETADVHHVLVYPFQRMV